MDNEYYTLPARGGLLYLLTLSRACEDCDAPPGITIEKFKNWKHLSDARCLDRESAPPLPFEKWADCNGGTAIITGYRKHEFVKAVKSHMDEYDAEEVYRDATFTPAMIEAQG